MVVCNSRLALELCTRCFASEVVQVKVVKRMSSVQGFIFEGKSYQVNIFCSGLGSGGVQVLAGK